jgi:hypothetical protein
MNVFRFNFNRIFQLPYLGYILEADTILLIQFEPPKSCHFL